eukprot:gene17748-biopygen21890
MYGALPWVRCPARIPDMFFFGWRCVLCSPTCDSVLMRTRSAQESALAARRLNAHAHRPPQRVTALCPHPRAPRQALPLYPGW